MNFVPRERFAVFKVESIGGRVVVGGGVWRGGRRAEEPRGGGSEEGRVGERGKERGRKGMEESI